MKAICLTIHCDNLIEADCVCERWGNLLNTSCYVKSDAINSPPHYTVGGLEVIDILKAKLSQEELTGYLAGNIMKYVMRSKHKNGLEDLKKAQWYLNKLIELEEKNGNQPG